MFDIIVHINSLKVLHMYKVIKSHYIEEFTEEVNKHIKEGWRPTGGVLKSKKNYYQALYKEPLPSS